MDKGPSKVERHEIAARVRAIIGDQDGGDLAATAKRLGVTELSLRLTIDPDSPEPTLNVLLAVVEVYGIDPTFLVTGGYDVTTHRQACDDVAVPASETIREILSPRRAFGSIEIPAPRENELPPA